MENKTIKFSSIEEHADRMFEGSQELTPKQVEWLDSCTEGTWKLNPRTRLVDVDWSFSCSGQDLEDLKGVRFGKVSGDFYCGSNRLTSLEGAPQKVGREFECGSNRLTSLEGAPRKVGYSFGCNNNQLTSLVGAPLEVGVSFVCRNNELTSLEGAPQKVRDFDCSNNQLTSLEGAPQKVGRYFYCGDNDITSLEGAPQKVGWAFYLEENPVSYETLTNIFRRMEGGKSYLQAVESLWSKIPPEDQILLYRPEFEWVTPEKKRSIELLIEYNRISEML